MSLINQMLKDLEKRTKPVTPDVMAMTGIYSTLSNQNAANKKRYHYFGLFFILLFATSVYLGEKNHHEKKMTVPENVVQPSNDTLKPISDETTPAILNRIDIQIQNNATNLNFLLNRNVLYKIASVPKKNQFIITFEHADIIGDFPPINYFNSAIKNIELVTAKNGNLQIILTLNNGSDIQRLDWAPNQPQLQLSIAYQKSSENQYQFSVSTVRDNIKKPAAEFNAREEYSQALNFLSVGQPNKAAGLLTNLLLKFPEFSEARKSLIAILMEAGEKKRAATLLEIGLQLQPDYYPFIELKARLLAENDQVSQALRLLERVKPNQKLNQDFYALIAALYQRNHQPELAAELYKQLLELHPNKAVWWMGLGIALESQQKLSEAKTAYLNANDNSDLTPELRAFVEERLQII